MSMTPVIQSTLSWPSVQDSLSMTLVSANVASVTGVTAITQIDGQLQFSTPARYMVVQACPQPSSKRQRSDSDIPFIRPSTSRHRQTAGCLSTDGESTDSAMAQLAVIQSASTRHAAGQHASTQFAAPEPPSTQALSARPDAAEHADGGLDDAGLAATQPMPIRLRHAAQTPPRTFE